MTLIPTTESLLKYDKPALLGTTQDWKSANGRSLKLSPQQPAPTGPVPPAPKQKSNLSEAIKQQTEEILNTILPPREWKEGNQLWLQQVSTTPCTRTDVVHLENQLKIKLQQMQARQTGICPVRRELYSQCFDELIRQVTINCSERGLLLSRVREEIQMTISIYHALYESSVAFGMRTALQAEKTKGDMEKRVSDLENEKEELTKQLNEQKAKCEEIEKRNNERRQVEEMKHTEEIQSLKNAIQQFKVKCFILTTKCECRVYNNGYLSYMRNISLPYKTMIFPKQWY
ncbi:axonemal dynein light intermediate polypeptide 1-like [Genypterus blacodes]|uniref:axonemal dynein light intermediate polypeptide 1-like n=1 Tax=Genypterus blacodes TaxID=154954 RepID=UPI003F758DE1